ncbi:MAG: hypothetical protein KDB23_27735 [Planctomycetales bacterium]|nr:hypothetical protein [Planctomycetales bacterium]
MPETIVITDTSVLINFLVLDKMFLLAQLPETRFVVTDHVRAEITEHHEDQLARLEKAFAEGVLQEISVTDLAEVKLFAQLTAVGLGIGECSAIAVASQRNHTLAIDDKRAVKKLRKLGIKVTVHSTETLMVALIHNGLISVPDADVMKREWEQHYRFRLTFHSFAERTEGVDR